MDTSALESASRSLESRLDLWGVLLVAATCLVVVGLILEYWRDVADFLSEAQRPAAVFPWARGREILGAVLVVIGVSGELLFTFEASRVETKLRNNNHEIVAQLTKEAGDAKKSAEDSANAADRAKQSSNAAEEKSNEAKAAASTALTLSSGARKEADSFEHEIVSAKTESADAVSRLAGAEQQLADATQREANAEEEINRLKSPRILTNASDFSSDLKQFAGTEYTFSVAFGDNETISLLKEIDSALQLAGWKRVPPSPAPIIGFKPYADQDLMVAEGDSNGVEVDVDSATSVDSLEKSPEQSWPHLVIVAGLLREELALRITPVEDNVFKQVVVTSGSSAVIRINVGKKRP